MTSPDEPTATEPAATPLEPAQDGAETATASAETALPSAATATTNTVHPLEQPVVAWTLLALSSLLVLFYARAFLAPYSALGDDASSHITTIATFARILSEGAGWWSQDYNLGFPLALYYQPLPHIVSGALCLLFGGPDRAIFTYKLLAAGLIVVQPWAVYLGMRRAGLSRLEAALIGAIAPLIHEGIAFGYNPNSSLIVGLYTQNWGNVALPLAVGELVRLSRGEGSVLATLVTATLVASCHMFYAIALVPIVVLTVALGTAVDLMGRVSHPLRSLVRTVARLSAAGVGAAMMLAAWLYPLSQHQAFFGGWPFGRDTRVHGYGWFGESGVIAELSDGHLLEAGGVPILLSLALTGVLVAAFRFRDARVRWALIGVVWSLMGVAGRLETVDGGGPLLARVTAFLIDLYPLHGNIQLFRYGALLQFFLLVAAGLGLAAVLRAIQLPSGRWALPIGATALAAILALPIGTGAGRLGVCFRTLDDTSSFAPAPYAELAGWVRELPDQGRLYVGPKTGVRSHFHSGLMAYWRQAAAGQSYGVGLHDSLHFYTLEYYRLDEPTALRLAELYDFRYLITTPAKSLPDLGDWTVLHENSRYRLVALDVPHESVLVMGEDTPIPGTPRGVRRQTREWLAGNGPTSRVTRVLEITDPHSRDGLTGSPRRVSERDVVDATKFVPHTIHRSEIRQSTASADVTLEAPGLVVFKVGYHPFWRATVDGEPAEVVYALPGFVAVRVDSGRHEVEASFRWPASSRAMLWLLPLALLFGGLLDRRRV
jgi:hypothetical protein